MKKTAKRAFVLLLAICMLFNITGIMAAELTSTAATATAEKIKVACIGDSITYGIGLPDRTTQSYPVLLQNALGDGYNVQNFGVSAYCALKNSKRPYWERDEYKASLEFSPDIVVIMLGTNDIKTENWEAVERNNYVAGKDYFKNDYCDLIATYKEANPDAEIYICTPPPIYLDENDAERPPLVLEFEGVPLIKEIAEATSSTLIDVFPALDDKPELFADKLHPNPEGAKIIADMVYEAITTPKPTTEEIWAENLKNIPAFSNPEGELTRDEFAYLVVNIFGFENDATITADFDDIADSIYKNEIQAAYSNGIIKGVSETSFDPSGKITRQEITLMLYRAWQVLYPDEDFSVTNTYTFSDDGEIAAWAKDAVVYMYDRKIMLGTSTETPTISPLANIQRDHSLLLMERIVNFCISK